MTYALMCVCALLLHQISTVVAIQTQRQGSLPHVETKTQRPKVGVKFPFDLVLFQHWPKAAGTTLRPALINLCKQRLQTLQICYDSLQCRSPVEKTLEQAEEVITFSTDSENQMVFGHGLRREFENTWGLGNLRLAWIAVMREPLALLLSNWHFSSTTKVRPYFGTSLDQWIEQGKAEAMADYYTSFLVNMHVPDPWAVDSPDAWRPSSGKQIAQNVSSWRESLDAVKQSSNTLLLDMADWEQSVNRLASFVDLTELEAKTLLSDLQTTHENEGPHDYELHVDVTKNNLARLSKAAELLSWFYEHTFPESISEAARSLSQPFVRLTNNLHEPDTISLQLVIGADGTVESFRVPS